VRGAEVAEGIRDTGVQEGEEDAQPENKHIPVQKIQNVHAFRCEALVENIENDIS
jgi:hypothetical protein